MKIYEIELIFEKNINPKKINKYFKKKHPFKYFIMCKYAIYNRIKVSVITANSLKYLYEDIIESSRSFNKLLDSREVVVYE